MESAIQKSKRKGADHKHRLARNNEGLIAGAPALNGLVSPKMATDICNTVNKKAFPEEFEAKYKISRNTLMSTLKFYTDFETVSILRCKTGSKDPASKWPIARVVVTTQMVEQ
jgi:hypothetical protein